MRAKKELQEEARRLRTEGKSVPEIQKLLGVSKSSVSLWVRGVELKQEQKDSLKDRQRKYGDANAGARANKERFADLRLTYQEAGRAIAREMRPLHLAGCMLYWAEGAKAKDRINFVNSDVSMMLFFMRFLREELNVTNSMISLHLHCHTNDTDEIQRIEEYWASLLKLPLSCLTKTQLHEPKAPTRGKVLKNGICGVRVNSTELTQQVFGAIQEYSEIFLSRPDSMTLQSRKKYSYARLAQVRFPRLRYMRYQKGGRIKAKELSLLHLAGCVLYWAEGAKTTRSTVFINSDPKMVSVFLKFLREELSVDESIIRMFVMCHSTDAHDIQRIEDYWLNLLALSRSNLRKTRIRIGNDKAKHNVYPNGFCTIVINRMEVLQHIFGAIQEYGGFDNPDWLF